MAIRERFGIMPALITPLTPGGKVMVDSLRRLIDYTIEGGVAALFVLGTTGEFYGIDMDEKRKLVEETVRHNNGRVPVYVGVGSVTTAECIRTTEMVKACGANGISVLTPYFISPSQDELYAHFTAIAKAAGDMDVILYNNLDRTHVDIGVELAVKLARVDNIVGIKDSTGDMTRMGEYIRRTREFGFRVFSGRDTLILANLVYGGAGAVAASANIVPGLVTGIFDSFMAGDMEKAREYQYRLAPLRIAFGLGTFPVVMKEAIRMVGIDTGVTAAPVGEMSPENREKLAAILRELGVYATR